MFMILSLENMVERDLTVVEVKRMDMEKNMESRRQIIRPIQGHECLSACIGNILNIYFEEITGNEIIIGGKGFDVFYEKTSNVVSTTMYEANFSFLDYYQVPYIHDKAGDKRLAKDILDRSLIDRKHIIIKVDASCLNYNRVFGQTSDAPHFFNIVGKSYDAYQICDGYVPTRKADVFMGDLDENILYKAWGNKQFEYIILEEIPKKFENIESDIMHGFLEAMRKYCKGGGVGDKYFGKDAVWNAFLNFRDIFTKEAAYELNYQLRIYGFMAIKEMTLDYIRKKCDLIQFVSEYEGVIAEWDKILMFFMKVVFSQKIENYDSFLEKIKNCMEKEDDILKRMIAVNSV